MFLFVIGQLLSPESSESSVYLSLDMRLKPQRVRTITFSKQGQNTEHWGLSFSGEDVPETPSNAQYAYLNTICGFCCKSIIFALASQFFKLWQASHKPRFIDTASDDTVTTAQLIHEAPINDKNGGTKQNFLTEECWAASPLKTAPHFE
jgi:hypothetical protein